MHSNRMNALIAVTRGVVCAAICTLAGMLRDAGVRILGQA